jgi:predicted NodU family carbamoyl transferase
MKPPAAAAAQKERFTRKKHDSRFPAHAIEYYLRQAGVTLNQIDNVVFYDKPFLKFERLVDYSARIQTVHRETNPRYHALLGAFKERTACQVIVNTSFNVRGEPIVLSPDDAFRRFMGSQDYKNAFSPD